jgi:hypothetical protein
MSDQHADDERPNEMPEGVPDHVPALDEAPDGTTPADTSRSSEDSLPPGA